MLIRTTKNNRKIKSFLESSIERYTTHKAIKEYEKLVEKNPEAVLLLNTLADLYINVGRVEIAINIFLRVAKNYCHQEESLKAIAMYKKILRFVPNNYECYTKIIELYLKQGLYTEALTWYCSLVEQYKKDGRTKNVVEILEKLLELEPNNNDFLLQLADAYQLLGQFENTEKVLVQLGQHHFQKNEFEQAINIFQRILLFNPLSKSAIRMLTEIWLIVGETNKAIEILGSVIKLDSQDTDFLALQGHIYLNAKMFAEAEEVFYKLLIIDNSQCGYLIELACQLCKEERVNRALKIVGTCFEVFIAQNQEKQLIEVLKSILLVNIRDIYKLIWLADTFQRLSYMEGLVLSLERIVILSLEQQNIKLATESLKGLIYLLPQNYLYQEKLEQIDKSYFLNIKEDYSQTKSSGLIIKLGDISINLASLSQTNQIMQQKEEETKVNVTKLDNNYYPTSNSYLLSFQLDQFVDLSNKSSSISRK